MIRKTMIFPLPILLATLICSAGSHAQDDPCALVVSGQWFCDDFEDGNAQDGMPVSWIPSLQEPGATITAGDGNLFLSGIVVVDEFDVMGDTSIRTRITLPAFVGGDNVFIGVQARRNDATNDGYSAALWPTQGSALIARETGSAILNTQPVEFDVTQEDVMFQFDAIGDTLRLWAWRPGDPMPEDPIVSAIDATHPEGVISLFTVNFDNPDPDGTFRFVQVAEEHIPEPSSAVLGLLGLTGLWVSRRRTTIDVGRASTAQ